MAHPPTTSHREYDAVQLEEDGIRPGLLRCSVGLEDLDDLIADFDQALAIARTVAGADTPPPASRDSVVVGAG